MSYLINTNIIALAAPNKAHPLEFMAWMERHSHEIYLSVITLAEIEFGIAKLKRQGAVTRARHLEEWLGSLLHLYQARIISLTPEIALETGRIMDLSVSQGQTIGFADCAIAATAKVSGFKLVTHNTKHFGGLVETMAI